MLELFFKHLDYIGIQSGREHESCEKRGFKFTDAETQKHWLSFYATHKAGYKQGRVDALNQISIHCINELNNV